MAYIAFNWVSFWMHERIGVTEAHECQCFDTHLNFAVEASEEKTKTSAHTLFVSCYFWYNQSKRFFFFVQIFLLMKRNSSSENINKPKKRINIKDLLKALKYEFWNFE